MKPLVAIFVCTSGEREIPIQPSHPKQAIIRTLMSSSAEFYCFSLSGRSRAVGVNANGEWLVSVEMARSTGSRPPLLAREIPWQIIHIHTYILLPHPPVFLVPVPFADGAALFASAAQVACFDTIVLQALPWHQHAYPACTPAVDPNS